MIQTQFAGSESLATILAPTGISGKNISSIQPYTLPGNSIEIKQTEHPRYTHLKIHTVNPVLIGLLVLGLQFTDNTPRLKIVIGVLPVFNVYASAS